MKLEKLLAFSVIIKGADTWNGSRQSRGRGTEVDKAGAGCSKHD